MTRGHEGDGREILNRHFGAVVVEAKPDVEGQPVYGPSVLRVQAKRRFQMFVVDERPRILGDRRGDAAQECPGLRLIRVIAVVTRTPHVLHSNLERVAARHVVRRKPRVILVIGGRREHIARAVHDSERRLGFRHDGVRTQSVDVVRLGPKDPCFVVEREAAFEQQFARLYSRPTCLEQVLGVVRKVGACLRRSQGAAPVAVDEPLIDVAEKRHLVEGRRLPCQVQCLST